MLHLTIQHYIYLTQEERLAIYEGHDTTVVGVSVPVWHFGEETSEPAQEVFCKYKIVNPGPVEAPPIVINDDGYTMFIPYRAEKKPTVKLSHDEWAHLYCKEPAKLSRYYNSWRQEVSARCLLDAVDGGRQSLVYTERSDVMHNEQASVFMHHVVMRPIEKLLNSIA